MILTNPLLQGNKKLGMHTKKEALTKIWQIGLTQNWTKLKERNISDAKMFSLPPRHDSDLRISNPP